MKIITFQHPKVIEELEENGFYISKFKSKFHKATPNSYKFLIDSFKSTKMNSPIIYPIFGWSQVLSIGEVINESCRVTINRMLEMTSMPENYYMLVLNVPENEVIETDFYGFVDLRFEEEFPEEGFVLTEKEKQTILHPRENRAIEIQAILGYINEEWIISKSRKWSE